MNAAHKIAHNTTLLATISLTLNGEHKSFAAPLSVAELVFSLNVTGKRIAIERNGEIVPKSEHSTTQLANGDKLEVVIAVGGG
jgi:sulfur carrier protein